MGMKEVDPTSTKPLIRWSLGPGSAAGQLVLIRSISLLRGLFGNSVDYIVCHNQLAQSQLSFLQDTGVFLFDQEHARFSLPFEPANVAWKLYPPRLRPASHELFIDNDILLWQIPQPIHDFLLTDAVVYTHGLFRAYGGFAESVPVHANINTGIFGVPPLFDLGKYLVSLMEASSSQLWLDRFDEQGMVSSILALHPRQLEISLDDVSICHDGARPAARCGHHFVSINSGDLRGWRNFLGHKHAKMV